jgi:hypothetical protein
MLSACAIVKLNCFVVEFDALSVTWTVNGKVPELDGVPLMVPVVGPKLRPPNDPAVTDQVYGETPPAATRF